MPSPQGSLSFDLLTPSWVRCPAEKLLQHHIALCAHFSRSMCHNYRNESNNVFELLPGSKYRVQNEDQEEDFLGCEPLEGWPCLAFVSLASSTMPDAQ